MKYIVVFGEGFEVFAQLREYRVKNEEIPPAGRNDSSRCGWGDGSV